MVISMVLASIRVVRYEILFCLIYHVITLTFKNGEDYLDTTVLLFYLFVIVYFSVGSTSLTTGCFISASSCIHLALSSGTQKTSSVHKSGIMYNIETPYFCIHGSQRLK